MRLKDKVDRLERLLLNSNLDGAKTPTIRVPVVDEYGEFVYTSRYHFGPNADYLCGANFPVRKFVNIPIEEAFRQIAEMCEIELVKEEVPASSKLVIYEK